jgi:uncharacterized protein with FMN-binding domain
MRRALIATAGTVAAVAALLSYKSSNAVKVSQVKVSVAPPSSTETTPSRSDGSTTTNPTTTNPPTTAPAGAGPKVVTGNDVEYNYGEIQLRVTTDKGKITKIEVVQEAAPDEHSQEINDAAIPILTREALAAQGLNFDVVSGATFTSQAFAQALQSAIDPTGR